MANISLSNLLTFGPNYCNTPGCAKFGFGGGNTQTFYPGNVYIAISSVAEGIAPNVTAGPYSFTLLHTISLSSRYLYFYTYSPLVQHTSAFWFDHSPAPAGACFAFDKAYVVSGTPYGSNGAVAIRQSVTATDTSANPSITMAPLHPSNLVMAFFINTAVEFNATPEGGFTELWDIPCVSYPMSTYAMSQLNGSDNTPSITANLSTWGGIAIEFRGGRRVSVIN